MAFRKKRQDISEIDPDVIFLDSANLPEFDDQQFEGRLERPISKRSVVGLGVVFLTLFCLYGWKIGDLQIVSGASFYERSMQNSLKQIVVFGDRGTITDRNGVELALNNEQGRTYIDKKGFAHILGYVGFPTRGDLETSSEFSHNEYIGKAGAEKAFNEELRGISGLSLAEVNAQGVVQSESVYRPPLPGETVELSIDARVQEKLYETIARTADERGFSGGAGVIMDVKTGEILAMTSYPEYDPTVVSQGKDTQYIADALNDTKRLPFLNRAVAGVYTPGSIVKPMMAFAALAEKIISPEKEILSTGSISIQNPYDKTKKTVFKDWKAHGYTDMRRAIAVSSDVYFYAIGGGYGDQKGLGIARIDKYMKLFGLSEKTGIELEGEAEGVIPTPEWKAANFDGEAWLIGNTYHTAIGQYGFGVTPLQMVRAVGAIANYGKLMKPTILKQEEGAQSVSIDMGFPRSAFEIVHEGMRDAVLEGTAVGLNIYDAKIAGKTGTAELGASKAMVNSWVEGFFPYEQPRYAFVVMMEKGSVKNTVGGVYVMRQMLDWMASNTPEYLK